jgi:hypothetical protein
VISIELAATPGDAAEDLRAAFVDEGFEVGEVGGFIGKAVHPDSLHYFVDVIIRHLGGNADAAIESAATLAVLNKVVRVRAIKRVKVRHPNSDGEVSTSEVSPPEDEPKRCLNYVLPTDAVELALALEALPADVLRTNPPAEKWWRPGHGWITTEEGWRLDGAL